jgi:hypothetical protein
MEVTELLTFTAYTQTGDSDVSSLRTLTVVGRHTFFVTQ